MLFTKPNNRTSSKNNQQMKITTKPTIIATIAFFSTAAIFILITKDAFQKQKVKEKEKYEQTKKEDYNRVFDSLHPVIQTIPTRYKDRDSLKLRVFYVEGCRWVGNINGGSADHAYHTVSNCPKCKAFFLSLQRGN